MATNLRTIPLNELSEHNTHKSCWIALHGLVFDITPFLNEHPGGPDVVVTVSGRDCTQEFEDVGHTDSARVIGDKYVVGVLEGAHLLARTRIPTNAEVQAAAQSTSKVDTMTVATGAGIIVAIAAFIFHFYSASK
jgi:cytochrome b involved in lipid metabolism